ncbi:hypothetical protein [Natronococcus amylolyticus]|uniref:hypothetical protein n=1 Tax=Natronococcus amylolyticus TaxID=44470 RepID=UPI001267E0EA|nr:hypothetical protein [Natronococcus amylolyticus]
MNSETEYSQSTDYNSFRGPVDRVRRYLLKGLLAGGLGLLVLGSVGTSKVRASSVFDDRAVYIWEFASVLTIDADARRRFFERTDRLGIETVYLSWGALRTVSENDRRDLITAMHGAGLEVHALTGTYGPEGINDARRVVSMVVEHNAQSKDTDRFDGIHLNVEFASDGLSDSLEAYERFLDEVPEIGDGKTVSSQGLTVSATVAWWWSLPEHTPSLARAIAAHPSLDYSVIMAYWDTPEEVRDRLATVVSDLDAPYVLAIETQKFPGTTANNRVTTYEEGWSRVKEIESAIATDPPGEGYLGIALHHYMNGLTAWDALWDARLQSSMVRPGDRVKIDTIVVFDDTFPTSSHESELTIAFDGPQRYTVNRAVTPPSSTLTDISVEWRVPRNAPAGEYAATVTLSDTTFEDESREKSAIRSTPVVLAKRDLGILSVTNPRRGRPN